MSKKPLVVYWTNQPSPYTVGRLNAVHDLGVVDICAWFDEVRQPDRSWDVDPSSWRFDYRWVPKIGGRRHGLRIPARLLHRTRPDLIVQIFDRPATALGALLSRAYARRVCFRVLPAYRAWGEDTPLTRAAKRYLFRAIDGAKVPGEDGTQRAEYFGLPRSRCVPVRQTIDVQLYRGGDHVSEDGDRIRADLGLKATTFIYVGRLVRAKGLDFLLDSFRRLRSETADVALLIVGDGSDGAYYRNLARETPDVHFAGFVQPVDLPAYYAAAEVLVFPTLGDPHGLVVEEAMAAGLAIISSDAAGDIHDRVEGRGAGRVVRHADVESLYTAMRDFAAEHDVVSAIGVANREAVHELTHDAYADDFVRFVHEVLVMRRRRSWCATTARGAGYIGGSVLRLLPTFSTPPDNTVGTIELQHARAATREGASPGDLMNVAADTRAHATPGGQT